MIIDSWLVNICYSSYHSEIFLILIIFGTPHKQVKSTGPPHTQTGPGSPPYYLSYLILVVDVCPSIQQHLYNGGMPITRGKVKGRPSTLHHIDRHGYILLHLLIHTQTIAQGDTGLTVGGCPGHADSEEEVHLRPIVTRVISYSEKWKSWKL